MFLTLLLFSTVLFLAGLSGWAYYFVQIVKDDVDDWHQKQYFIKSFYFGAAATAGFWIGLLSVVLRYFKVIS